MNFQVITGFLVNDAKVKIMDNGDKLINFAVSAYNISAPKDAKYKTTIYDVSLFTKSDNTIDSYLKTRSKVLVAGTAGVREYNGKAYNTIRAQVGNIELISTPKTTTQPEEAQPTVSQQETSVDGNLY